MRDAAFPGFTPAAFRFLRELARHNAKPWFEAHRAEYETHVRAPMRALVEEMDVRLATIAPEIVGDPRTSVYRIHRDVRFSADKSPYKTNAACQFFHRDARHGVGREAEGSGAGFYFQLAPGACFVGAGIWMPPKSALDRLRDALAEDHETFAALLAAPAVRRTTGGLDREAVLVRVPRGVAPDHPAAELLKFKSFMLTRAMRDEEALGPRLPERLARIFGTLVPVVRWLNSALGLPPAARR